ncbi:C2H2-type zinc finger protein [Runella salmonicolor]|nr:C2H2-type zinc finger protein [Runella salmonicolor]
MIPGTISVNVPQQDNKYLHEMEKIMHEVLTTLHNDMLNQRRGCFRALETNAEKAGVELMLWIKEYTFKNSILPIELTPKPNPKFDREEHLVKMRKTMECYSDNLGRWTFHLQRKGYYQLINDSYKANVPLIEWLVSYYAEQNPNLKSIVSPIEYKCPACGKEFSSQNALNAHRVEQCRAKHQHNSTSHVPEKIN